MRHISLAVCLCCFISITSCTTSQNIAGNKSAPCNLPFPRIATREFSYPTIEACRGAAEIFFDATPASHPDVVDFSKTKLNDNLYMWRGLDSTEIRFVVRFSIRIPQAINYWEIEKSSGDDNSEKLKKKIDNVINQLEESECKCKVIRQAKETPDDEVVNKRKAWRAIVKCSKKTKSSVLKAREDEDEVSGIVINPSYP